MIIVMMTLCACRAARRGSTGMARRHTSTQQLSEKDRMRVRERPGTCASFEKWNGRRQFAGIRTTGSVIVHYPFDV